MFAGIGGHTAQALAAMRAELDATKALKVRDPEVSSKVRYKVGQVFHHKRYQYNAVIIGWDKECAESDQWMAQMRVHELPRGRYQSFYNALVEDGGPRYVAEENIQIIEQESIPALLELAGQYFKRWDHTSKTFISNIRDEYPDD